MINIPKVKLGVVAVSRDCFPIDLSERRRTTLMQALAARGVEAVEIQATVENELDAKKALEELAQKECNALVMYLGNFGPEGPETLVAQHFDGPVMFVAAAEEDIAVLASSRGDAYCGLLNASYNLGIRGVKAFIPEEPVGMPEELAAVIQDEFLPVACALIGVKKLKIFGFGPRPTDFVACNAPIAPLFDLGVEIQENSELDLFMSFNAHENDPRIPEVVKDMEAELGDGNKMPEILPKLAQYELTLLDWVENNRGMSEYVAIAGKCWPAFQEAFGFVPCYVNSRLTGRGIPVSCEVDIYGALSEFIAQCVTGQSVTLLDINNTVPKEMYQKHIQQQTGLAGDEVFMGFHCGNTCKERLVNAEMKYQLIMNRNLENCGEPVITRGTIEGAIAPSDITLFRLQGDARCVLRGYVAEGSVLDVDPCSFGGIGVIAIPEMRRFYRHVLVKNRFPHHGVVAFEKAGKNLFTVLSMLGAKVDFNRPKTMLYEGENPFSL